MELGLKLTRVVDDFTAADLLISKDRGTALFLSRETETMFILTAHLKGYKRENIKMDINEDGSILGITGEKPVQELVMAGGKVYKKEMEMRGFKKAFKIPAGVILDKIEAKFNKDESHLTITIPKSVKGIRGIGIEEVKGDELARESSGSLQITGNEFDAKEEEADQTTKELPQTHEKEGYENLGPEKASLKAIYKEQIQEEEDRDLKKEANTEKQEAKSGRQEKEIQEHDPETHAGDQQLDRAESSRKTEIPKDVGDQGVAQEGELSGREKEKPRDESSQTEKTRTKKSLICAPVLAGSALLVSLIVLVIHIIRDKSKQGRKK